jgi:flagellar motility protein MotE (MotC chaperone)
MSNKTNVLSFCHSTGSNRKIQLQCWLAQQISREKGKTKTILIRERNNKAKEIEKGEKAMEGKTQKKKGTNQREEIRVLRKRTLVGSEKLPIYD